MEFSKMIEVLQQHVTDVKNLQTERLEASKDTTGGTLRGTLARIDKAMTESFGNAETAIKQTRKTALAGRRERLDKMIEDSKQDYLTPDILTGDFALLNLPIPLTVEEAQVLVDRNWNNPLFIRAAREKFRGDLYTGLNFQNPAARALQTLEGVFDSYVNSIKNNREWLVVLLNDAERQEKIVQDAIEKFDGYVK